MTEEIEFKIKLRLETIHLIDEFINYGKIKNKYGDYIFPHPETYEEFIKGAIDNFIIKLENIKSFVINEQVLKLKSKDKLKNNLKKFMEDKGYTQSELSSLTGVDQSALSHILSNRNQPSIDYFLRIWIVLGCPPIEEIFYRDNN